MRPGDRLGPHRIRREIGAGGSAGVYEAEDAAGRTVAIKLLHAELASDAELVLRLLNEKRIADAVPHPGVLRVFESGLLPDNVPYLVMEYMPSSLAGRMRRTRLSPAEILGIAAQIARALAAAHDRGVVHRDLKPSNVLLDDGPAPLAKVSDFGLAKIIAARATAGDLLRVISTTREALFGTREYRAPEQWVESKDVDGAADVYALGALLHELWTGRTLFCASTEKDWMYHHLFIPPPALPGAPSALASLCARMLAKARRDRPAMNACATALARAARSVRAEK